MVLLLYVKLDESRGGSGNSKLKGIAIMERDEASLVKKKCLESVLTKNLYQILERKQQHHENTRVKDEASSI